jgi:putative addiction module killer protein
MIFESATSFNIDFMYLFGYNAFVYSVFRTDEFDKWLGKLRDAKGKARIIARIRSAELGNLGDVSSVGGNISEMRIHFGPGYRVYFTLRGKQLIILLLGGDKSSQKRDINKAKSLAADLNLEDL